jgi:hypothetical protein
MDIVKSILRFIVKNPIVLAIFILLYTFLKINSLQKENAELQKQTSVYESKLNEYVINDKVIEAEKKMLIRDLVEYQMREKSLIEIVAKGETDEDVKNNNPVNFINPNAKWSIIKSSIDSIANGTAGFPE